MQARISDLAKDIYEQGIDTGYHSWPPSPEDKRLQEPPASKHFNCELKSRTPAHHRPCAGPTSGVAYVVCVSPEYNAISPELRSNSLVFRAICMRQVSARVVNFAYNMRGQVSCTICTPEHGKRRVYFYTSIDRTSYFSSIWTSLQDACKSKWTRNM